MMTNKNSRIPLYVQVEDTLLARITSGELPPGSQLPTEEELIKEFDVSRTTIRKTIQSLLQQGLVEIRRGKGTFVTLPKITQELTELTGFVEDMQVQGRTPTAKVLGRQIVAANDVVARQLIVPEGTPVVQIYRVRLADNIPVSFDETYLPRELGEKILAENLETDPIFTLLEQKYETPLIEAKYQMEAVAASPVVAEALEIEVGSPIFLIERTSYTEGNRPVDYEKLHYRGDQIRFVTQLARRSTKKAQEHNA
ncbi:GntR family transcriptional regulator [Thermosporothrix hazakensis]|jgi:GntR family transcriptional regulator|uniref:GntR family transcriptional regulator n=2 Tax=Thermosporothrix hazakensis TaxID=644383 RepID=A0A326UJ69_THEHA|nr:GntR family transcriptional regulator [Thermosporothrix hazakensis]PZW32573.1 GntR family transcriptional regulator [Thermosporothrix hazakensis]GCE49925.1 GntR family transcriptional regulator [Thermosporothrix hazakensis]